MREREGKQKGRDIEGEVGTVGNQPVVFLGDETGPDFRGGF